MAWQYSGTSFGGIFSRWSDWPPIGLRERGIVVPGVARTGAHLWPLLSALGRWGETIGQETRTAREPVSRAFWPLLTVFGRSCHEVPEVGLEPTRP